MSALRMSDYVYGPKDDPFTRTRWFDPYPAALADTLGAAAAETRRRGMIFTWAISPGSAVPEPGSSIRYGSDEDLSRLLAKLDTLRELGIDHFALFLDDLHPEPVWPEDRARFSSLAEAHVFLANRVAAALDHPLLFVGNAFSDEKPSFDSYNTTLGESLDESVEVMWTGPKVVSATITASDAVPINTLLKRQVSIWDNWPPVVEPLRGRSADLHTSTRSFFANPIVNESFNWPAMLPAADFWKILGSIGDYTWDPATYDADQSHEAWAKQLPSLLAGN